MNSDRLRSANISAGSAAVLCSVLAAVATVLFLYHIASDWPAPGDELAAIILYNSTLPRGAVAWLAGAVLGLAGALMQRVLRNPIADPSTVGVAAGASLAMSCALIYAPSLMAAGREYVAFFGGAAALSIVMALSWRRALDPVTVVLCGMLVSLMAAAISATLILARGEYMMSLFIWGGGSLEQQDWGSAQSLALRLAIGAAATACLARALTLLALDDAGARALGLGVTATRLAALSVAVFLSASVTAEVGIIGFVGLAAPNFVRLMGACTLRKTLLFSPLAGGIMVLLSDGLVRLLSVSVGETVPTGAVIALFGGPLLLWLLPRISTSLSTQQQFIVTKRAQRSVTVVVTLSCLSLTIAVIALFIGRSESGWAVATGTTFDLVAPWRWPRVLAAASAGGMLAAGGFLMQRLTGNAMASPEVLGVSSGAGVGLAAILVLVPGADHLTETGGATAGAFVAFMAVAVFAVRHRFAAERLLLSGIAVGSLGGALVTLFMSRGGPESRRLLSWLSGTTQNASPSQALWTLAAAIFLIAPLPFLSRWMTILPLGRPFASAIGLKQTLCAGILIVFATLLSAASTLFVGPLSFVGLMAPHMARMIGLSRPLPQLAGSVLLGIVLMMLADWAARTLAFPYQLPIGLIATMVGAPYLVWMINRR